MENDKEIDIKKTDKLLKLEEKIKDLLLKRGFSRNKIINNGGLIGAAIEDVVNELIKKNKKINW